VYKKILVPVDGSPTSVGGLQEAIRLAKDQGASLRLVHVVDEFLMDSPYAPTFDYQAFLTALRAGGNSILEEMRAMAREQGVDAESELQETIGGRASDKIVEAALRWPADLIVMGTHGRRGVRRLLMGSDAELVLHSTPVPVLMIRGAAGQSK
jgi:nucleotide-binding universal stress UspA family protein